jgi:hypothetical protein
MRWAMRIFGGSNVVASLFGLCYFAWGIQIHLGKWPGNPNRQEWIVFLAISALSTSLVLYLAYLGVRLIKRDFKVLRQVCFVFVSEIAICFVDFIVTWMVHPTSIRKDVEWFWGIALFPVQPQVYFGYAFIGLTAAIVWMFVGRRSTSAIAA